MKLFQGFEEDGKPTSFHFRVFMARLAFVIVFEHAVFGIKYLVSCFIGDVPGDIVRKERSEQHLLQKLLDQEQQQAHAES